MFICYKILSPEITYTKQQNWICQVSFIYLLLSFFFTAGQNVVVTYVPLFYCPFISFLMRGLHCLHSSTVEYPITCACQRFSPLSELMNARWIEFKVKYWVCLLACLFVCFITFTSQSLTLLLVNYNVTYGSAVVYLTFIYVFAHLLVINIYWMLLIY